MIDIIAPKKSLGQNFLIDDNISRKIIQQLDLHDGDIVLEIGPGTGALTTLLLEHNISLFVVEIDKRAVELLQSKFADRSITIINDDIRNVNINEIAKGRKIKVIGNLPYYISADILFLLFENYKIIERTIIMLQKEVAKRVCSKPDSKDYGILAVAASMIASSRIAFDVSANCFYPKPKVTSSILQIDYDKNLPEGIQFSKIMKLVKAAFSQRRKTLRNSLKAYISSFPPELVSQFNEKNEELLNKRAETLTTEDFMNMYRDIINYEK